MSEPTTQLRRVAFEPIAGPEQVKDLLLAAAADDHIVIAPSHVARLGDDLVGYASIGSIPVVNVWLDSQRVKAIDSLRLLRAAEQASRDMGIRQWLMPCAHTSPFYPHMERLGFKRLGFASLNWKGF
jgi:hypothetical protein